MGWPLGTVDLYAEPSSLEFWLWAVHEGQGSTRLPSSRLAWICFSSLLVQFPREELQSRGKSVLDYKNLPHSFPQWLCCTGSTLLPVWVTLGASPGRTAAVPFHH